MVTKEQMDALKQRFIDAKNEKERLAVNEEIHRICEEDTGAVAEIMKLQLLETHRKADEILVRKQLEEILPAISLAHIAKTYFRKSRAWLYQRINGLPVNGKPAQFTESELDTLNKALNDIGGKLSRIHVS